MSEPDPADRLAFVEKQIKLTKTIIGSLHEVSTYEDRDRLAAQAATLRLFESERDQLRAELAKSRVPMRPMTVWLTGAAISLIVLGIASARPQPCRLAGGKLPRAALAHVDLQPAEIVELVAGLVGDRAAAAQQRGVAVHAHQRPGDRRVLDHRFASQQRDDARGGAVNPPAAA